MRKILMIATVIILTACSCSQTEIESDIPVMTQIQGDSFRGWIIETHPDYAEESNLDSIGPTDNSFMKKAWNEYGSEFVLTDLYQANFVVDDSSTHQPVVEQSETDESFDYDSGYDSYDSENY